MTQPKRRTEAKKREAAQTQTQERRRGRVQYAILYERRSRKRKRAEIGIEAGVIMGQACKAGSDHPELQAKRDANNQSHNSWRGKRGGDSLFKKTLLPHQFTDTPPFGSSRTKKMKMRAIAVPIEREGKVSDVRVEDEESQTATHRNRAMN